MDPEVKRVLMKAAKEVGVELAKIIGRKIVQVADELHHQPHRLPGRPYRNDAFYYNASNASPTSYEVKKRFDVKDIEKKGE